MPVIKVTNLSKSYVSGKTKYRTLREHIANSIRPSARKTDRNEPFLALDNLSFEVERGELFAVVGPNGSGKSTLLKILARIHKPTSGHFEVQGKIGALLEMGCGFHPDLSGRDNIWLSGSILGIKRAEIRKHFDRIVDFSGIEAFIDKPVKTYSSGMYLRLGFSVSAHLSADILLVDEALSFGDQAFQGKCLKKFSELQREGKTIILTTHDMESVLRYVSRGVCLERGKIVSIGSTKQIVQQYIESCHRITRPAVFNEPEMHAGAAAMGDILTARMIRGAGETTQEFADCEPITVEIVFANNSNHPVGVFFLLETFEGFPLSVWNSEQLIPEPLAPGKYKAVWTFPPSLLNAGKYRIKTWIETQGGPPVDLPNASTLDFEVKAPRNPFHFVKPALSINPAYRCAPIEQRDH